MDAQDTDLLLDQAMALISDRSGSVIFDLFDASRVAFASIHECTVGADETTAQDLDTLSQAGTIASCDGAHSME